MTLLNVKSHKRMSSSRAESQHSLFGRRRSNTAQSVLRPLPQPAPPPLNIGDTKSFSLCVHETKDAPDILFNHSSWPGVTEGDLMRVNKHGTEGHDDAFLFFVPKEDQSPRSQLHVRALLAIAKSFPDKCLVVCSETACRCIQSQKQSRRVHNQGQWLFSRSLSFE